MSPIISHQHRLSLSFFVSCINMCVDFVSMSVFISASNAGVSIFTPVLSRYRADAIIIRHHLDGFKSVAVAFQISAHSIQFDAFLDVGLIGQLGLVSSRVR